MPKLYNHQTASLSLIDLRMIRSVPSGGNWKNIPKSIPSERIKKIRLTGGRTTYYGRLRWDKPSYTINTYFNRPGGKIIFNYIVGFFLFIAWGKLYFFKLIK